MRLHHSLLVALVGVFAALAAPSTTPTPSTSTLTTHTTTQSTNAPTQSPVKAPFPDPTESVPTPVTALVPRVATSPAQESTDFARDCADPQYSQVKCTVLEATCDEPHQMIQVAKGQEPPEAHDLRVHSHSKIIPNSGKHQLFVDISWQMPPGNDSYRLRAFLLEIVPDDDKDPRDPFCYLLNVSDYMWSSNTTSPRFHFTTETLFTFSADYSIRVRSLPRSRDHLPIATKKVTMSQNPGLQKASTNDTELCRTQANSEASKWTAGFRRIFLHAIARTINVQFIAAPPSLCFESYEVRLLDEHGLELLHSHIVDAVDLKVSNEGGNIVYLGEHNFTDLEPDIDYIPSVMPVERSEDGRCLCPVENENPNDRHMVCSCIAADWKKVRLGAVLPTQSTQTTVPPPIPQQQSSSYWPLITILMVILFILFFLCILFILYKQMKKYRSRGKLVRTRFVTDGPSQTQLLIDPRLPVASCGASWTVLIVYAHDCAQHEAAVLALAEFLRDSFNIKVHIDRWEQDEIEANLHDYINNSILRVDKVLVVNSIGAYCRLQARARQEPLERINTGLLDRLFEAQIDMALQHARVISMRFSYTPQSSTLFSLSPLLQYSVPENLPLLLSALTESSARNDPRLMVGGAGGYDPALDRLRSCITRMQNYIDSDPEWFENSHCRVPMRAVPVAPFTTTSSGEGTPIVPRLQVPAIAEKIPLLEDPFDSGIALSNADSVTVPQKFDGVTPQEVTVEEEDQQATTSVPTVPVLKDEDVHNPADDSAYLSGSHLRSEPVEASTSHEEIPMTRLSSRRDEEDSIDSGKDEETSSEESQGEERRNSDCVGQQPHLRIEDALRVKAKGDEMDTGDSGNISDYHSGLVENC